MSMRASTISTTVRNVLNLALLRTGFALGSHLAPTPTLRRAARMFCTPYTGARARAQALPLLDAELRELDVDGRPLAVYVWGDPAREPYLLFAHGWSSGGARIGGWVPALRAAGYAVVAFDQLGHGRSPGTQTTLAEFVRHVIAVGAHYGPAAAVVGHSLGGAAVSLALARGLQARRAVLVAPAADPIAAVDRFSAFVGLGRAMGARLLGYFESRFGVVLERMQAHRNVGAIAQPALVVHDIGDREVPWDEGERYARLWPGARLLSTSGLGHKRVLDDPWVIDAALAFLRGDAVGQRVVSSPNLPFGVA